MDMNTSQGTLFPLTTPETPATKLAFKQWQLREGERLYNKGAESLSNTELLAHITRDQQLAERLMQHFGTLEAIADASIDELQQVSGVGEATSERLLSAIELGRRAMRRNNNFDTIKSPQSVLELMGNDMKHLKQEEMRVLLLDTRNNVRKVEIISKGTLDCSLVHARDVFRAAIKSNAKSIILVHNHISNSVHPSSDDCNVTKKLVEAGKIIDIDVISKYQ